MGSHIRLRRCGGALLAGLLLASGCGVGERSASAPRVPARPALGARHLEEAGGYSFQPPAGWSVREFPGVKYRVVTGPVDSGFAPNINIMDGTAPLPLAEYVAAAKAQLRTQMKSYRELGDCEFRTASGLDGRRLATDSKQEGKLVRQIFYFLSLGSDKQLVVTCTSLAREGDLWDSAFDASIVTLRLEGR